MILNVNSYARIICVQTIKVVDSVESLNKSVDNPSYYTIQSSISEKGHLCGCDALTECLQVGTSSSRQIDNTLQWRHNGLDGVSNHQPHHCLPSCLFGCRSKKVSKLHVTGLCAGNSPGTGEFPAQKARNAENVSIWWRHHEYTVACLKSS